MDLYYLVIEEYSGFKYPIRESLSSSLEEVEKYLTKFKVELYKNVEIKTTSISIDDLICILMKEHDYLWHSFISKD